MNVRSDDGSILPLTIFFGVLSLALMLAVVAATSLYLERKRLFTLADGAALVAAESFALESVKESGGAFRPQLQATDIARSVAAYLEGIPTDHFRELAVVRATTDDGVSATVTLSSRWQAPVVALLFPDGVRVEVTSAARSVFY